MSDLDCRLACDGVVIERQQAGVTERLDHRRRYAVQLGHAGAAASVLGASAPGDTSLSKSLRTASTSPTSSHSASARRPLSLPTPELAVPIHREAGAVAAVVELGQRVLQKGEARGVGRCICNQRCDQGRFDGHSHTVRRSGDGTLELVSVEGCHGHGVIADQLPEPTHRERSVVEVGPERDDCSHPRAGVGGSGHECIRERDPFLGRCQREQLLELVDDQDQLSVVVRQDSLRRSR